MSHDSDPLTAKVIVPPGLLKHPVHFLSLGFGSGLSPIAPGTFGTLAAIPLYLLIQPLSLLYYLSITLVTLVAGFYLCEQTAKTLGVHDHGGIVWDEIVGFFITMIAVPFDWKWIVAGFILFRFFDIVKPWPIKWIDAKVSGGVGIMLDDVLAGIFALIGLHLIIMFYSG